MSDKLAYGIWVTKKMTLVVFDRSYSPFLIVDSAGNAKDCKHHFVEDIMLQIFLWNDGMPNDVCEEISKGCLRIMREAVHGRP